MVKQESANDCDRGNDRDRRVHRRSFRSNRCFTFFNYQHRWYDRICYFVAQAICNNRAATMIHAKATNQRPNNHRLFFIVPEECQARGVGVQLSCMTAWKSKRHLSDQT